MRQLLLSILLLFSATTYAQELTKTISLGQGYANSVWYNLGTEVTTIEAQNQWDLAFSTGPMDASVRVNHSKGVRVFIHPNPTSTTLETMDITVAESEWDELFNSEEDWFMGALNSTLNSSNPFDFGWGAYSIITHNIQGNQLYAIKLADNTWRKFRIVNLLSGTYNIEMTQADGTGLQNIAVAKSASVGRNFGYLNLSTGATFNLEPLTATWDLFFGQYFTADLAIPYNVTGVLINVGVEAARIISDSPTTEALPEEELFTDAKNEIGYDWKNFNMAQFAWVLADDLVFFVKDLQGEYWRIIFTGFGGQSTGNIEFTAENLGTVNVNELTQKEETFTNLFPNPAKNHINLVVDNKGNAPALAQLFDISGKMHGEVNLGTGFIQHQISTQHFKSGLYFIRLMIGEEVKTLKFVVN
ncbi:MAG: T9SS type A sorting domain-containing protein [Luteibaculaceae bacterium]